jgi:SAM-dependent methyltransferase
MPTMKLRPLVRTLRAGDTRGRLNALRTARPALTLAVTGAALRTGLLEELRTPTSATDLASRRGWDGPLTEALLRSFAAHGLLRQTPQGWRTSTQGERILADDIVRATHEAFAEYHTGLYRDIESQLVTGGDRQDIELDGELIARLSRFMDEFVLAELDRVVRQRQPTRVLDVGCGAAAHLRHLLHRAPQATGIGVETDEAAAELAKAGVQGEGLAGRAEIVGADVRDFLGARPDARFDLVLLANVVYYIPPDERVALLTALAGRLDEGGRLLVVTTALTDDSFSRHFDLLLRAQRGAAELPDMGVLADQLRRAGLVPEPPRRIAPGEPLTALLGHRR